MEFTVAVWMLDKPEEIARDLRINGVTAVELGSGLLVDKTESRTKAVVREFKENGIRIFSAHAPIGEAQSLSLSALRAGDRKKAVKTHKKMLERSALAGVHHVVIHPGSGAKKEEIPQMEALLPDSLYELIELAEKLKIKLALENMPPGYPGQESASIRRAVESIASPWLGVCFDTGHPNVAGNEGVNKAFSTLRDLIIAFHIHDNNSTYDMHIQPPYGTINWHEFTAAWKKMNFKDPMCLETMPWAGTSWRLAMKEMTALFETGIVRIPFNGTHVKAVCEKCGHYLFGNERHWFCACNG